MVSPIQCFANGESRSKPSLIAQIQDRYGQTIFPSSEETQAVMHGGHGVAVSGRTGSVDTREQVLRPMNRLPAPPR